MHTHILLGDIYLEVFFFFFDYFLRFYDNLFNSYLIGFKFTIKIKIKYQSN